MPKMQINYTDQINFLAPNGTMSLLRAISYYRGSRGFYADPARDFMDRGIREFVEGLSPKDRKRFDEILENVKIMANEDQSP